MAGPETGDYASGLTLLAKYSKNRILLQNLSRKPLPAKLEYELRKLSKTPEPPVVPPANIPAGKQLRSLFRHHSPENPE